MPDYIKLCLETWKFPFKVLNYDNLRQYTDYDIERARRFTLPQQADCVRVHVLRDNGGYWLDADTISVTGKLPEENMIGDPEKRTNSIGFLHTQPHSDMFERWAAYQDNVIANPNASMNWDVMGNAFTDKYVQIHRDITICDIKKSFPETYMINGNIARSSKYLQFYFKDKYNLSDLIKTDMLMLHNSWTPVWYKELSRKDLIVKNLTISNILREVLCVS